MNFFSNLDLISIGIAIAATVILGFTVFLTNRRSITNQTFLYFTLVTAVWGTVNYASYHILIPSVVLQLDRLVMFFAVWQAYFLYRLFRVFPAETHLFSRLHRRVLFPVVLCTSLLTLTPFVFSSVVGVVETGKVAALQPASGILLFVFVAMGLLGKALYLFLKKIKLARETERRGLFIILAGVMVTFALIIFFNLILTAVFQNPNYVPLGALFTFPFIVCTSYAIYRHHFFNIKIITVSLVGFLLTIFSFFNIVYATDTSQEVLNITYFLVVLLGTIILIQSILKEVRLREALQVANEGQQQFLHFLSHEVKGFLAHSNAVYDSILTNPAYAPISEGLRAMIDKALYENRKGVAIVEDLLMSADLKSGAIEYTKDTFNLKDALREKIGAYQESAKAKGLYLQLEIDEGAEYTVRADQKHFMDHAIRNLLENAIIYTMRGGITIHLARDAAVIRLTIHDTGIGISPEDKGRLFTAGGRGVRSREINVHSTGHGLYIARKTIVAQGGKVWVESEGEGKGSTFVVELPAVLSDTKGVSDMA